MWLGKRELRWLLPSHSPLSLVRQDFFLSMRDNKGECSEVILHVFLVLVSLTSSCCTNLNSCCAASLSIMCPWRENCMKSLRDIGVSVSFLATHMKISIVGAFSIIFVALLLNPFTWSWNSCNSSSEGPVSILPLPYQACPFLLIYTGEVSLPYLANVHSDYYANKSDPGKETPL